VRRQSAATTALWLKGERAGRERRFATVSQSEVALRLPPHSKSCANLPGHFVTGLPTDFRREILAIAGPSAFNPLRTFTNQN